MSQQETSSGQDHHQSGSEGVEPDAQRIDVHPDVTIGYRYEPDSGPTRIGSNSKIRSGTIIYADVEIGERCETGHRVTIREETTIGNSVLLGTNVVVDGRVTIGSRVSLQTGVYLPPGTTLGDDVFIGPYAVLMNDPYPLRVESELDGPTIADHVTIGANASILPGVTIGHGAFIAAGAVVTRDVPAGKLAVGNPAEHRPLPEHLQGGNVFR